MQIHKFKWSDDLVEDLLKALSNFKVMGFQNKNFNTDKPSQNNISILLIFSDIPRLTMTQKLNIKYAILIWRIYKYLHILFTYTATNSKNLVGQYWASLLLDLAGISLLMTFQTKPQISWKQV